VEFALRWQSAVASHNERLYYERINFWRDFFPGTLGERLAALPAGGVASQSFAPGELLAAYTRQPYTACVRSRSTSKCAAA